MRILQDAIIRLLKQRPFYGQLLLQFRRRPYAGHKAVAVTIADAVPTLMVSESVFARYSPPEQQALLEHLVKHILHLHPCRRKQRQARLWDIACDLAINPGIDNLPPEALLPHRLKLPVGLAAEEYYDHLRRLLPQLGHEQGDGHGDEQQRSDDRQPQAQGDDQYLPEQQTLDDHQPWQESDRTPESLSQQVVRQMVHSAWKKYPDTSDTHLMALVAPYLAPPAIPWQQILRQFVGTAGRVGKQSTWKREHRRFGLCTPGVRKQQYLNLLVAIDVSDSTDTQPLREAFAAELLNIARARQCRITTLYSGSRIQKISRFSGHPAIVDVYRGGGFTDLRPVFAYARTLQPRPAAIIYLTDGFGPAPAASDIPTLWVLSPEGKKPVDWGIELRLESLREETS